VFVALPKGAEEFRGELEPVSELEEWVPLVEGEAAWEQIGAEQADWVAAVDEGPEIAAKRARLADVRAIDPAVVDRSLPVAHERRTKRVRKG
jgi:hypothetical protein